MVLLALGAPAFGRALAEPSESAKPQLTGLRADDSPTQRIVRLHYDGPDGDGTLKLVLRIQSADDFQLEASDRLGRRWWNLRFNGEEALVLWVRDRIFCRYGAEIEIEALPLGPVAVSALPALLLDRLPVPADTAVDWKDEEDAELRDGRNRLFKVQAVEGELRNWSLWQDGSPFAWWTTDGKLSYLSAPRRQLQLRWQQTSSTSPLTTELADLSVPEGYVPGVCEDPSIEPSP